MDVSYLNNASLSFSSGIEGSLSHHVTIVAPCIYIYRSVPQIRPPSRNLSLSTKRRGGLYAGCEDFSRDYAPPSCTDKA